MPQLHNYAQSCYSNFTDIHIKTTSAQHETIKPSNNLRKICIVTLIKKSMSATGKPC